MIKRRNPAGGKPEGLQDTADQCILSVPQMPCNSNMLDDHKHCHCLVPCLSCACLKGGQNDSR